MGYHLMQLKQYYGNMQAITWDKKNDILTAASDPRAIGLATSIGKAPEYGVNH
jgi:gamma-glutamyltranspeptidase/glutathione hydrolase